MRALGVDKSNALTLLDGQGHGGVDEATRFYGVVGFALGESGDGCQAKSEASEQMFHESERVN
jgi:hypothetical protein